MFYIYLLITALSLALIIWIFVTEKDWRKQASAAMVIIPLLMRVFLIK